MLWGVFREMLFGPVDPTESTHFRGAASWTRIGGFVQTRRSLGVFGQVRVHLFSVVKDNCCVGSRLDNCGAQVGLQV